MPDTSQKKANDNMMYADENETHVASDKKQNPNSSNIHERSTDSQSGKKGNSIEASELWMSGRKQ